MGTKRQVGKDGYYSREIANREKRYWLNASQNQQSEKANNLPPESQKTLVIVNI